MRTMKKVMRLTLTCLTAALMLVACNGNGPSVDAGASRTIDSLKNANLQQQANLEEMNLFVNTLADGLSAIALQEDKIFSSAEGTRMDRNQLKVNLESLAKTLQDQRKRIQQLSDSLKQRGANTSKLQTLVTHLQKQLEEKDRQIAQLRKDVEQKNLSISDLQNKLQRASAGYAEMEKKAESAETALAKHTSGYVLMGTIDALKEGGYIDKRKHVLTETMPKGDFTKVNIYQFSELEIPSKSVKLLTDHPKKSYSIEKVDKETRKLVIDNPDLFWATSRYLIISIK